MWPANVPTPGTAYFPARYSKKRSAPRLGSQGACVNVTSAPSWPARPAGFQKSALALSATATPVMPMPAARLSGSIWRNGTAVVWTIWAEAGRAAPARSTPATRRAAEAGAARAAGRKRRRFMEILGMNGLVGGGGPAARGRGRSVRERSRSADDGQSLDVLRDRGPAVGLVHGHANAVEVDARGEAVEVLVEPVERDLDEAARQRLLELDGADGAAGQRVDPQLDPRERPRRLVVLEDK